MYRRRNEQLVEAKTSYFTKKVEESRQLKDFIPIDKKYDG